MAVVTAFALGEMNTVEAGIWGVAAGIPLAHTGTSEQDDHSWLQTPASRFRSGVGLNSWVLIAHVGNGD